MTIRSHMVMSGTLVDGRATEHTSARLSATIAIRLTELQSIWVRFLARRRLARSIAHLDDRLLADVGLSSQDLGFAERAARSRATRDGIFGEQ